MDPISLVALASLVAAFASAKDDPYGRRYIVYRGIPFDQLPFVCRHGYAPPSDPAHMLPHDPDLLKYCFPEEWYDEMETGDETRMDAAIVDAIPWYDPNDGIRSLEGGVNASTDPENAAGYGDVLLGLDVTDAEIAEIHSYVIVRDTRQAPVVSIEVVR
jgi:hypothetical protein